MNRPSYLVAVNAPLPEALTYLSPENGETVTRGQPVLVPLGRRKAHGVVLRAADGIPKHIQLKPILGTVQERPALPPVYMDWLEWMSQYYIYPLGPILESVFPPLKKHTNRRSRKPPLIREGTERVSPPELTIEQSSVVEAIRAESGFAIHLVHGVTGSGKTEVYLRLLEDVLARGQRGLVLVPEISLTPQLIERFSKRFPDAVAVLHSHLTEREKTIQWWSIIDGQKKILIGARSALFCPMANLGLIILDEEHEPSYKQDEKLKYHARDAAVVLAKMLNVPIVLGSATPSLESWNNAIQGKYRLHAMNQRVNARPLPEIEVVDLREQHRKRRDEPSELPFWLSEKLFAELQYTFARGEQAALFLNRRGVAQAAQCHGCGYSAECPNCSVALTLHGKSHLVCHYCEYSERLPETCPDCKEFPVEPLGLGTERVEKDVASLFPGCRIARADRDEVHTREQLEKLIEDMEQRRIDLLIGTQMIAKGLDFPYLNLVGLVLADVGFHWPDFRASERSFQLLTQVSGRSGRKTAGRVVIQTYDPSHVSIVHTLHADFKGFAEQELLERSQLHYPPYWRMAMIRIHSGREADGQLAGRRLLQRAIALRSQFKVYASGLQVLGPATAPLFKLRNRFRFQVIVKGEGAARLNQFCRQLLGDLEWVPAGTKVQVDIDPFAML
jgi:primosomal protein N' (replication factor Y)